jgi:uncharacterized RDD family membrane protein YckC
VSAVATRLRDADAVPAPTAAPGTEGAEAGDAAEPRVHPPAALWRRASARLLDAAVVFFVLWVLVVLRVLWFMGDLAEDVAPEPWGTAFVPTVAFVALFLAYEVVYLVRNQGQTPGKELMKVRVVRAVPQGTDRTDPTDGRSIGTGRALVRSLLPVLTWLASPALLALALLFAPATSVPWSRRRAAWHDHLGGTAVVHYDRQAEEEGENE